jgi:hypothetical protein
MTNNKISTQFHREKRSDILLKRKFTKKVSSLLATLLLLSVMLPTLAFAANKLDGISYNGDTGTIQGAVYLETYVSSAVYVSVYDTNRLGTYTVIQATYDVDYGGPGFRYTFSRVVNTDTATATYANYNPVSLAVYKSGNPTALLVSDATYAKTPLTPTPPGGGGGGGFSSSIIDSNNKADATKLASLLASNANATLDIPADFVLLPLSALANGTTLTVKNAIGSYTLPLKQLNADALAKQLGVDAKDILIRVSIAKVDAATQASIVAATYGKSTVLTTGVDFKVMAEATGKTAVEVTFGNHYTKRTINIDKPFADINTAKSTGVLFAGGAVSFVPSTFAADGSKTVVTIQRIGNSIYTAISSDITFKDVANNWSKKFIDTMVNKQIIAGYVDGTFKPRNNVTRAEFVSILVNALGVKTVGASTYGFTDVASNKWYADAINSAAKLGLIAGKGDKTFSPEATITRQEAASIVANALKFVAKPVMVTATESTSLFTSYKDKAKVANWAKENVAIAIKSGIILGVSPTALNPVGTSSRAEAVTMLSNFLEHVEFIN